MPDRPTAPELVEAVREYLETEVLPLLDDDRMRFRALVAINALVIAGRELAAGALPEPDLVELARRLRAGDVPDGVVALLQEHVAAKLRVSNPRYLATYE
jgi:hypothetical protein